MAPCALSVVSPFASRAEGKTGFVTEDKTDYSPVVEPAPPAEQQHERRQARAFLAGVWSFWLYALVIAGVVALVIWLV